MEGPAAPRRDILWPHADMRRAADAYLAARTQAEQHGVAGERATSQAQRALVLAFTDPRLAGDEIDAPGSTSASSAVRRAGTRSTARLRPPPGRRARPSGGSQHSSYTRDQPDPAMPDRPAPINRRRCRSSRCGMIASNLACSKPCCSLQALSSRH